MILQHMKPGHHIYLVVSPNLFKDFLQLQVMQTLTDFLRVLNLIHQPEMCWQLASQLSPLYYNWFSFGALFSSSSFSFESKQTLLS